MTRKECLDKAAGCVLQDRANEYGGVEDNFGRIANFWSVYLGRKVYPADVAAMMALLKIARARSNPGHDDSWVDLAGYAACGAECAGAAKAREDAVRRAGEECRRLREQEQEPEFNPGDKVEFYEYDPSGNEWLPAEYVGKRNAQDGWHLVHPLGSKHVMSVHCGHLRKAKLKAEDRETLVEQKEPQTKEEQYDRLIILNPPRVPTGEELAEMAQEDSHG